MLQWSDKKFHHWRSTAVLPWHASWPTECQGGLNDRRSLMTYLMHAKNWRT